MLLAFVRPEAGDPAAMARGEAQLGATLPGSFRRLLVETSNGGEVHPVASRSAPEVGLQAILGLGRGDDLDIAERLLQYQGRLPSGLVPVADAEGGNLVCLSVRSQDRGSVWFWDHELETGRGPAARRIAVAFDAFLDDLVPVTPEMPSRVVEAWIDPDLLAEFGDGADA